MTEPVVLFIASSIVAGLVGFYSGQIAAERRMSSLEGAVQALGQKFDLGIANLAKRLDDAREETREGVDHLRSEVRTYYARKP